jgi:hypothetical protein
MAENAPCRRAPGDAKNPPGVWKQRMIRPLVPKPGLEAMVTDHERELDTHG